jgi:uncharacterized protein (DUF983 family)
MSTPKMAPKDPHTPSRWWGMLRQRCPDCCRGRVFRTFFEIHEDCPVCGLSFRPEPGFYLGAMYLSYPFSIIVLSLFTLVGWLTLPAMPLEYIALLAMIPFLPLVPFIYRYSRVCWLYFDRWGSGAI